MKTFLSLSIIISIILLSNFDETNAQEFLWAKSIIGNLHDQSGSGIEVSGSAIAHDADGNIYVTGKFPGTATFDTMHLTSFGKLDMFIAKYDPNGKCLWAKQAGGINCMTWGYGIAVDGEGNSYVAGSFSLGTIYFDSLKITNCDTLGHYGRNDIYVAKYDSKGTCQWVRQAGGIYNDEAYSIAVDNDGNCSVTGYFEGPVKFGTDSLESWGQHDIFIAQYDKGGNCNWVVQAGHSDCWGMGYGIALDRNDNIYITGYFIGTMTFGNIDITSYGGFDVFVAKYDQLGNCQWVQHAGGSKHDICYGLSVDKTGNIFITGVFCGPATFGKTQLEGYGTNVTATFVAKYAADGYCYWAKQAGGSYYNQGIGISADINGNSYITGNFSNTAIFDTIHLNSRKYTDIFIAKYSSDGLCQWALDAGGKDNDIGLGITVDTMGNCFATGTIGGMALFGTTQLSDSGAFITKIGNPEQAVKNEVDQIPKDFMLQQNYPNPFNPSTTIKYSIPKRSAVTIKIYDITGRELLTLLNSEVNPGNYEIKFDASKFNSGVFFYTLRSDAFAITKKMILIK